MEVDETNEYPQKAILNPDQYTRRMQALAMEVSEQRLKDGSASSAEIVFWLKSTSRKEQLEIRNLEYQGELLKAKTEAIGSQQKSNEAYQRAMEAFAGYLPSQSDDNGDIIDADFREIE